MLGGASQSVVFTELKQRGCTFLTIAANSGINKPLYVIPSISYRVRTQEGKVKVKVTLVQALRLCTGRTAHRGSRGIALLYRH
jgi:hypothetical protein